MVTCEMVPWVTRVREGIVPSCLAADQAGAVDERVERLIDGGEESGRGVVGVLEGDHVGHLFVEVDTGRAFLGGVGLSGDLILDVVLSAGPLDVDAEAVD